MVRVDGATGAAELIFTPPARPGRGPRDVIGLAAGDDCIFAGCFNGTVYCLDRNGMPRWETHAGSPVVSAPLTIDINGDAVGDAVVITSAGKVVAISGQSGRTAWVATIADPPADADMLGAVLAAGEVLPGQGTELVATTPSGSVAVLRARDGHVRWRHDLAAGTVAGAVCRAGEPEHGPDLFLGDRGARLWSVVSSHDDLEAAVWGRLALRPEETLIAGLRTLQVESQGPPLLLACPTGGYAERLGGVCAVTPDGLRWRWAANGAVWGTPAVADLNGDHTLEVVVTSIEPDVAGQVGGVCTILSCAGHSLQQWRFAAPLECSPVVADVDGDGRLEVLVADQSGLLHCFATQHVGPVKWGLVGGDCYNTRNAANAFAYGQVPFGYQWKWRPE